MWFSTKGDDWREAWDYGFRWTQDHMTAEQLRPLIYSYDELATECLTTLEQLSPVQLRAKPQPKEGEAGPPGELQDMYELLERHADEDERLQELWRQVHTVPDWVDWAQIERGQRVFYRYAGPFIVSLTFQSLLGGMGSRRVVETLTRTGGFGARVARRRLLETFQHVLAVTRDTAALRPGGAGFVSTLRVRLLHAAVRRRVLRLAAARPGCYYDAATHGVPINDLDSAGTIAAFCAAPLWVGFPRQGIFLPRQEAVDYVALWRYVAYLIGAPERFFATPEKARATMESLLLSEIVPTRTGQVLANNIIAGLHGRAPSFASADFLRAEAHWLNGHALADALALPRPPLYYTALVAGQCAFFMAAAYLQRALLPARWDDVRVTALRRILQDLTVEQTGSREATHGFRYVPSLETPVTEAGDGEDGDVVEKNSGPGSFRASTNLERRNLYMLLVVISTLAVLGWLGARGLTSLLGVICRRFEAGL